MNAYSALGNFQGSGDELLNDRLVKASAPRAAASHAPLNERVLEPWVGGGAADDSLVAAPKPPVAKCVPLPRARRSPG
jgi:hypothetical protein